MMQCSARGLALIKAFEGFSAKPYRCPAGKLTIGYGHVLHADEVYAPEGVTEEQAHALLEKDVRIFSMSVNEMLKVPLPQASFDAVVSLAYNIGAYAIKKSTLIELINQNSLGSAAKEFDRWVYAGGKILPGLKRRRQAERQLFEEGLHTAEKKRV